MTATPAIPETDPVELAAPGTFAVTRLEHPALRDVRPACPACLEVARTAAAHARATGSVGCTYGDGEHSATVTRAIALVGIAR